MNINIKEIQVEQENEIKDLNDFIKRQEYIESYMESCKYRRRNHLHLLNKVITYIY